MQYRSYKADIKSNFFNLPSNSKRAIEIQANIEVLGYQLSKTYGKKFEDNNNSQKKFEEICDKYAQDPSKIKILTIKDSRVHYIYPYTEQREGYYLQQATEYALNLDKAYTYLQLQKGNNR